MEADVEKKPDETKKLSETQSWVAIIIVIFIAIIFAALVMWAINYIGSATVVFFGQ